MTGRPASRLHAVIATVALGACAGPLKAPRTPAASASGEAPRRVAREPAQTGPTARAASDGDTRDPSRPARALVFRAAGFPTIDAPALGDGVLDAGLSGLPVERAGSVSELRDKLRLRDVDVLVLPYGSAFPVDAWPRIRAFLDHGGGLAVLGGAPFHEPVREGPSGSWVRGPRAPAFAHALLLGPAEAVPRPAGARTVLASPDAGFKARFPTAATTWALTLRLATTKDMPGEHGSAGPRDRTARPLVHVLDAGGTPRGCPLIEIDHRLGDRAGARWVLATSDARLDAPVVHAIVARALEGATELEARPVRATVAPGEHARVRVQARRFFPREGDRVASSARVVVRRAGTTRALFTRDVALAGVAESRTGVVAIDRALRPGLYEVVVTANTTKAGPSPRVARTGFWVRDEKLLASSPKLGVSRDWLRKDGKAFPVVGTTYMASDVHRKFLFEPNPWRWDRDFAEMQRRGVNFVRTGLWTAWSRAMLDPGAIDEGVLSALDAFVLTAARHGIVVCFDAFAFLPPAYGGDNPYLDPRALQGQRELLTLLSSRYRGTSWIHWDLINEPSYAPRESLWKTRAIGDRHERRAWEAWVRARHGRDPGAIRQAWSAPEDDLLAPPQDEDFEQAAVQIARRPKKARDFSEFTQDVVAGWASNMRAVIRAAHPGALVTLGQDEGGIYERPLQQLLAPSLDYTAVHTWWNNDDLLWDGVLTKVPEKPNLHQETGLMRLEHLNGAPWRTPQAAAQLLSRKLGYAFAARGAGVVEWAWNVNPFMPIDEESTIGLFRPDGTAKPELDALADVAAFAAKAAPYLDDFAPDPVVLVVPHARAMLGRARAMDATKVTIRVLAERFGVVPTALSDLRLTAARLRGAKLVLLPGAEVLDEPAARAVLEASRAGAKVLFTGPVLSDSYGREAPSLRALGVLGASRPVAMRERTRWSASGWVTFEELLQESLLRADGPSVARATASAPARGALPWSGNVWREPVPLALAREPEPFVRMLGAALAAAGVAVMPDSGGVSARVLVASKAALVAVVNERPEPAVRRVRVFGAELDVPVAALSSRLAVVERRSGAVVAETRGLPVAVPAK